MEVIVGLGSNVEPERNLPAAVRRLAAVAELVAVSSAWATTPVGPPGQLPFVNAAVRLRTALPIERVKAELLRPIEAALGRVRGADRFAPRPIDLDLVAHRAATAAGRAEVADLDLLRHAHVALPASEVAPEWLVTPTGERLAELATRLVGALPAAACPRRLELTLSAASDR
ncbi:MAG TPA: 2-amino-4-hydroxy-6-hydroxymethyldihydropteridine diphosphokinase [Thermoanaerobaculia bacterium]|nr:2-amino-4-hydroxy-6-hydroxymethyldihydropteridine diphosphokinase [Thermoanaerobaculia bacterium]